MLAKNALSRWLMISFFALYLILLVTLSGFDSSKQTHLDSILLATMSRWVVLFQQYTSSKSLTKWIDSESIKFQKAIESWGKTCTSKASFYQLQSTKQRSCQTRATYPDRNRTMLHYEGTLLWIKPQTWLKDRKAVTCSTMMKANNTSRGLII